MQSPAQYILLNKPVGYSTERYKKLLTKANGLGNNTRDITEPLQYIAPLPEESEGLLVFVSKHIPLSIEHDTLEKEYEVTSTDRLTKAAEQVLERGLMIEEGFLPGITIKKTFNKGRQVIVTVIITGDDERLRPMFERLGLSIVSIRRLRIGTWKLGTLPVGRWRIV